MKNIASMLLLCLLPALVIQGQTERLTNNDVIILSRAGLSQELIKRKIRDSDAAFDTTTEGLIDLKKSGVADDVIGLMMEKSSLKPIVGNDGISDSVPAANYQPAHIVLDPKEALTTAKTIALEKSSLQPSRQALEKELMKRSDWKELNLNIVRHKEDADLYIEVGFVPMSWITHRYVWRVYDNKSGTVIAAGETTSWGSLPKNLARDICEKLSKIL
jgi:hypothetical protein